MGDLRHRLNPAAILLGCLLNFSASAAQADIVISLAATQNMVCSNGVCTPTAANAVLNVADLEVLLNSSDTKITTTGSGVQAKDIDVRGVLTWTSMSALTLAAYRSIEISRPISVEGSASVSLVTNDGGADGTLAFDRNGRMAFYKLSSRLTINDKIYTLVNAINTLASDIAANPAGMYALANDYDASQDGTYPAAPISTEFSGTFEGLGNTISKLQVDSYTTSRTAVALFGQLDANGVIENLKLVDLDIVDDGTNGYDIVGGLVASNAGTLFNDHAEGAVTALNSYNGVGGLAGFSQGAVDHSSTNVDVASKWVGGLVGVNWGTISSSSATGNVETPNTGGGAGGLVGASLEEGVISESFATGDVSVPGNNGSAGGLLGWNQTIDGGDAVVENCYAKGAVSGNSGVYVGGLVGVNGSSFQYAQIENSYSTGPVSGETGFVGGFVGQNGSSITQSYWDVTTSGTSEGSGDGNIAGVTGLTTKKFRSGLPSGFDPRIWKQETGVNGRFPYLKSNPPRK